MKPLAKICGVTRPEDARLAREHGAAYVGAVMYPDSPRRVTPEEARRVGKAAGLPLVLVVVDRGADEVARAARTSGARVLQLHGSEHEEELGALGARGWELWKAARVGPGEDILALAERWVGVADLLLLDARDPRAPGGTGRVFPWVQLEAVRDRWPAGLRLGIAGGLGPGNVAEAIRRLRPDLVDVSTGVEAHPGVKDPEKLRAFLAAARGDDVPGDPVEGR